MGHIVVAALFPEPAIHSIHDEYVKKQSGYSVRTPHTWSQAACATLGEVPIDLVSEVVDGFRQER
jgi:hypothetical protein